MVWLLSFLFGLPAALFELLIALVVVVFLELTPSDCQAADEVGVPAKHYYKDFFQKAIISKYRELYLNLLNIDHAGAKCEEFNTELPYPVLEMRRLDIALRIEHIVYDIEFHSAWYKDVLADHLGYASRLAENLLRLRKENDAPFKIVAFGIFPGAIKEHEQLCFPDEKMIDEDLGCLLFTFIPVFIGDRLGGYGDIVDKYWDRIVAWAEAGRVGAFPLTDPELFELLYSTFGSIPADPFPVTRKFFWMGTVLSGHPGHRDTLSLMYVSVVARGGLATEEMLAECVKEMKYMKYDIIQLINDVEEGVFSLGPNEVRALKEENKVLKSQAEAERKALEEKDKALEAANSKVLEAERKALEAERKALEAERKALEAANSKVLEAERKVLEAERTALEAERKALEAERKAMEEKDKALEAERKAMETFEAMRQELAKSYGAQT
ncbi:MAG: hypothetical protein LBT40_13485 [Deltaproteobacteria bacterium]|jgi:hypothetical protein|nr:hypothetical protein [Deltaproteobacteria bacterium]